MPKKIKYVRFVEPKIDEFEKYLDPDVDIYPAPTREERDAAMTDLNAYLRTEMVVHDDSRDNTVISSYQQDQSCQLNRLLKCRELDTLDKLPRYKRLYDIKERKRIRRLKKDEDEDNPLPLWLQVERHPTRHIKPVKNWDIKDYLLGQPDPLEEAISMVHTNPAMQQIHTDAHFQEVNRALQEAEDAQAAVQNAQAAVVQTAQAAAEGLLAQSATSNTAKKKKQVTFGKDYIVDYEKYLNPQTDFHHMMSSHNEAISEVEDYRRNEMFVHDASRQNTCIRNDDEYRERDWNRLVRCRDLDVEEQWPRRLRRLYDEDERQSIQRVLDDKNKKNRPLWLNVERHPASYIKPVKKWNVYNDYLLNQPDPLLEAISTMHTNPAMQEIHTDAHFQAVNRALEEEDEAKERAKQGKKRKRESS